MKKIIKIGTVAMGLMTPLAAFAAQKDLDYVIGLVIKYFQIAVYLIIGLAIVMFTYNIFRYFILGNDNPAEKKDAGLYVMWSVIGFFVIISMWGLVKIVTNTFNLDSNAPQGYFGSFNSTTNDPFNQAPTGSFNTPSNNASSNSLDDSSYNPNDILSPDQYGN